MESYSEAVLITAGTGRLGFYFAQASLAMGYQVILHYRSSPNPAGQWVERNPIHRNNVHFIRHDLSQSPETIIDTALRLPCTLVGLVNNASLFSEGNLADLQHLEEMVTIHLMVPARLGTVFHKNVSKGWIINLTDAIIDRPNIKYVNYRMSKLFLRELTRQQAASFAPNVRVNALAPGAILPSVNNSEEEFLSLADKIPLQTTGNPESLTGAFEFLVKNEYCTGQTITVDGGWSLTA